MDDMGRGTIREERGKPVTRGISKAKPRSKFKLPYPNGRSHLNLYFIFYFLKGVKRWLFFKFSFARFSIKRYFWNPFLCGLIFPGQLIGMLTYNKNVRKRDQQHLIVTHHLLSVNLIFLDFL